MFSNFADVLKTVETSLIDSVIGVKVVSEKTQSAGLLSLDSVDSRADEFFSSWGLTTVTTASEVWRFRFLPLKLSVVLVSQVQSSPVAVKKSVVSHAQKESSGARVVIPEKGIGSPAHPSTRDAEFDHETDRNQPCASMAVFENDAHPAPEYLNVGQTPEEVVEVESKLPITPRCVPIPQSAPSIECSETVSSLRRLVDMRELQLQKSGCL